MSWSVERDEIFGCDLFTGPLDNNGYGTYWSKGKARRAHVVAWERAHGEVPEGFVIDHTCARRACCRVAHLQLVTQQENLWRRKWSFRTRIKRCKNDHDLRLTAMVTPEMGRACRTCTKEDE